MVVIAQDAQGAAAARPWVAKAGGTYRALLDQHNAIGKAYNLKYVPVGIAVDEQGRLAMPVGAVDIGDADFRAELEAWAAGGAPPRRWRDMDDGGRPRALTPSEREADGRFQAAIALLARGETAAAIAELEAAVRLDPQNWLIRKQLWAVAAPEAFYAGDVDYAWQKARQQAEERTLLGASAD